MARRPQRSVSLLSEGRPEAGRTTQRLGKSTGIFLHINCENRAAGRLPKISSLDRRCWSLWSSMQTIKASFSAVSIPSSWERATWSLFGINT